MAEFVSPNEDVIFESLVIGASAIGFFVRPVLYYRRPHAIDATSDVTGVLLVAALLLLIMAVQVEVVIAGGLVACCALGYCGSTAHANFARRFAQNALLGARRRTFLRHGRSGAGSQPHGDACRAFLSRLFWSSVRSRRWRCSTVPDAPSCATSPHPSFEPECCRAFGRCVWNMAPSGMTIPRQRRHSSRAVVRLTVATAYASPAYSPLSTPGFTTSACCSEPSIWAIGRACCLVVSVVGRWRHYLTCTAARI